ncbi:MAG: hypothetical protein IJP95_06600, partial [Bacteroidales bacterium]|nr:hypothetical protein [Bacteroidales bacterium]
EVVHCRGYVGVGRCPHFFVFNLHHYLLGLLGVVPEVGGFGLFLFFGYGKVQIVDVKGTSSEPLGGCLAL